MSYLILQGNQGLAVKAQLSDLDCLATLIAAACPDLKHDGFNNPWHANKEPDRFKQFGKDGTQEKYHFAESWRIMTEEANFISNLSYDDQQLFKMRMQGCIYATDMGRHMTDLTQMKDFLVKNGIKTENDPIVSKDWEGVLSS